MPSKPFCLLGKTPWTGLVFAASILILIVYVFNASPEALHSSHAKPSSHRMDKSSIEENDSSIGSGESQDGGESYAVVIDAGSSGSRAYLYVWPEHSGDPESLLDIDPLTDSNGEPLVKSITPGLSSLADSPSHAGNYISPLLDFAVDHIPDNKIKSTHLFILATAGMRLLPESKQSAILNYLRQSIAQKYKFIFSDDSVEVIEGKDEGIYQWISINYVLGKFDPKRDSKTSGPRTVGALDMGGASLQIAMEIFPDGLLESLSGKDRNLVDDISLGAAPYDSQHQYKVFVTTFLGYGANEALNRHRRSLLLSQFDRIEAGKSKIFGLSPNRRLMDPCLPKGLVENTTLHLDQSQLTEDESAKLNKLVKPDQFIYLLGSGDWNDCYIELSKFIRSGEVYFKSCLPGKKSCADEGMKSPPIDFRSTEFYAFSEFWYTAEDILKLGGVYNFDKFRQASQAFCGQSWGEIFTKFQGGEFPLADYDRLKTQCFKSAWVTVALHQGLNFPESYTHLIATPNSVDGRVIHWTLGALLYRTRHLPKSAIEARFGYRLLRNGYQEFFSSYAHFIILVILSTIITFLAFYLKRLRRFLQPKSTLRKVPSMNLFSPATTTTTSTSRSSPSSRGPSDEEWTLLRNPSSEEDLTSTKSLKVYVNSK